MSTNSQIAGQRFFIGSRFDDFDAFTETARAWDLSFQQLERGKFDAELLQCGIEGAQIGRAKFNRKLDQFGASPPGLKTFVIPANPDLQLNWRKHQITGNDMMIFPEGGELASVSNACFDVITISLTDSLLEQITHSCESSTALHLMQTSEVIQLTHASMQQIRKSGLAFLAKLAVNPAILHHPNFGLELHDELPRMLIQAIAKDGKRKDKIPSARLRSKALKSARDAIFSSADEPITITRICEITGASERTLQYAFHEEYGLSPKQYLQAYRLNHVRKVIRSSDPDICVISDIANAWGFWHMGQFAADYRRLFGELPSVTTAR